MKKLAIIDLMFTWPPDGGARVDLKEVVSRLAEHFEITLFIPRINCVIERGRISGKFPFNVEILPFEKSEFIGPEVKRRFGQALKKFNPDLVFIGDGYFLRPWVAEAAEDYPTVLKFYAYENLCLRFNGSFMRGDRPCYRTGVSKFILDSIYCSLCGMKFARMNKRSPYPGLYQEYMGARTWHPGYWKRIRRMLDRCREIIVYNEMLRKLLDIHGWASTVIPGGINTAQFPRKAIRSKDGTLRLGVVGRIDDELKGIKYAIRAMSLLQQCGIDTEIHLTGNPDDSSLNLPGVIYRGWFDHDKLHKFYESIDIFIMPSIWQEPFGIVSLEAMCSGRPVVASSIAGQKEIIRHGENGLLVAPQSPEDIVKNVLRYYRSPEFTEKIVNIAELETRKKYDWDRVVDDYYLPLLEKVATFTS
ncbi:glycosyltransferase family 4 protein [bacterium]|nr:glycosyltransferase family 4 protein [bacterium]